MEELYGEFLQVGIAGAVAVLFIILYMKERQEHNATRQKHIESIMDRLNDSKQVAINIIEPIRALGVSVQGISDKIEISKRAKK